MKFDGAIGRICGFLWRQEARWPKSDSCLCPHHLQVSRAVLPRYRSRFSKHQFTQPQLLAILCLMRYEDWTFREAELRPGEHRELRQALGLASVPDFTTLYRFLQRLDDQTIDRAVSRRFYLKRLAVGEERININ